MTTAQQLESSLRQPPPRDVPAPVRKALLVGAGRWHFGMLFAITLCVVGFLVFFPWLLLDEWKLDQSAARAQGEIVSSVFSVRAVGKDLLKRRQNIYRTDFVFYDQLGKRIASQSYTTRTYTAGERVEVEYDITRPLVARTEDGFLVPGHYWAGAWALTFPAFIVFGLWNYRHWRRQRSKLLREGILSIGTIERMWGDRSSPDNDNGWVAFRFEHDGETVQATESVDGKVWARLKRQPQHERKLTILHRIGVPRDCIVLELLSNVTTGQA